MVCCSAGNYINPAQVFNISFCKLNTAHIYWAAFFWNTSLNQLLNYFWLFVYFFNHEMLITAFFGSVNVPFHFVNFFFYFVFVIIKYFYTVSLNNSYFVVVKEINISCMMKYSRYIRRNKIFALAFSYYKRTILSCCYKCIRIITAKYA